MDERVPLQPGDRERYRHAARQQDRRRAAKTAQRAGTRRRPRPRAQIAPAVAPVGVGPSASPTASSRTAPARRTLTSRILCRRGVRELVRRRRRRRLEPRETITECAPALMPRSPRLALTRSPSRRAPSTKPRHPETSSVGRIGPADALRPAIARSCARHDQHDRGPAPARPALPTAVPAGRPRRRSSRPAVRPTAPAPAPAPAARPAPARAERTPPAT